MKILLVIDDTEARNQIKKIFIKHKTTDADTEKEVFWLLKDNSYDVVIVDWTIGLDEGLMIGKAIRAVSEAPLVFLMFRSKASMIAKVLDSGFDDCMVKPFFPEELYIRVKNLSKRRVKTIFKETKIIIGELCIDLKQHVVTRGCKNLMLTKSEYQILKCLALRKETLIRREKIMASFSDSHVSDQLLNMHITNLRKKVGALISIVTIPGKGYVIR